MTKGQLLDFLEPFTDDIPIFVEGDMGLIHPAEARYALGRKGRFISVEKRPICFVPEDGKIKVTTGQGIVIL